MTNGQILAPHADRLGTLKQVGEALQCAKKTGADVSLAWVMLRHGRLTDEARAFVQDYCK